MSRTFSIWVLLGAGLLAGNALAVLPPDAEARAPQIRADYLRREQMYQERMEQRQRLAVEQYKKTEADIFTPPWKRTEVQAAQLTGAGSAAAAAAEKAPKRNHRLLISIVLLILIGAVAGWVRHVTREADEL